MNRVRDFFKRETVLCIAAVCAVISMFFVPPSGEYIGYIDFRVLGLLWCLMAVVAGLRYAGLFEYLTHRLLERNIRGRTLDTILVLLPFFCSMIVTNDVALLTFVPFTLGLLPAMHQEKKAVPILVLQTAAANLGSMATPVGNPQNLFLYGKFELAPGDFFPVVLPVTLACGIALTIAAMPILPREIPAPFIGERPALHKKLLLVNGALFLLALAAVFRTLPWWIALIVTAAALFFFDRDRLREPDLALLATFVCFFIFSGNLGRIAPIRDFLRALMEKNALLTSALASQVISNVPAAVLLSGFTENWRALLLGTNIGGLGTPVASLASLITMKLYFRIMGAEKGRYILWCLGVNVVGLAALLAAAPLLG